MSHSYRKIIMTYREIDLIFPIIVLFYGALMTFVLNNEALMNIAQKKFPPGLLQQMQGHRILGIVCLCVGSIWTLQNLWLT